MAATDRTRQQDEALLAITTAEYEAAQGKTKTRLAGVIQYWHIRDEERQGRVLAPTIH